MNNDLNFFFDSNRNYILIRFSFKDSSEFFSFKQVLKSKGIRISFFTKKDFSFLSKKYSSFSEYFKEVGVSNLYLISGNCSEMSEDFLLNVFNSLSFNFKNSLFFIVFLKLKEDKLRPLSLSNLDLSYFLKNSSFLNFFCFFELFYLLSIKSAQV